VKCIETIILIFTACKFYVLCATACNASCALAIDEASVCPSIRLFLRLPHSAALSERCTLGSRNRHCGLLQRKNLVSCDKISCRWVRGFSSNEGV